MPSKVCRACGEDKTLDNYYAGKSRPCKECCKKTNAAYYKANKDKVKAKVREYRAANKEEVMRRDRAYYAANRHEIKIKRKPYFDARKELAAARQKKIRAENGEAVRERDRAYYHANKKRIRERHRKRGHGYQKEKPLLFAMTGGICGRCNALFAYDELTVDHIKARSKGGTDDISNLQLMCMPCNASKYVHDEPPLPRLKRPVI